MPANWTSLTTFIACQTQWVAELGMAGLIWIGMDYPGVDVVLRRSRIEDPDAVFADIQIMEGEALDVFAEVQA